MNEQELNKKLAEWAGFREADIKKFYYWEIGGNRVAKWIEPNTDYHIKLPRFTQSLDACFKWLVPKLQDKGHNINLQAYEHKGFRASISEEVFSQRASDGYDPYLNTVGEATDENPALALCLAIEKLIDGEK